MLLARRFTALALAALAAPILAGCATGVDAATNLQGSSGDGASAIVGPMQAHGLVLVRGIEPGQANLLGTIVNTGTEADALTAIAFDQDSAKARLTVAGKPATSLTVAPGAAVQFGHNSTTRITISGLQAPPSNFVPLTLHFRVNGSAQTLVLTAPATGTYAGLGPLEAAIPLGSTKPQSREPGKSSTKQPSGSAKPSVSGEPSADQPGTASHSNPVESVGPNATATAEPGAGH